MTKPLLQARRRFLGQAARLGAAGTLPALAAGARASVPDARGLGLVHTHTHETLALVYAVGPHYVPEALDCLDHFLRDHYTGTVGHIDPAVFELLHGVRQLLGSVQPFEVISGYRSEATNERLRVSRGGGVARQSLHMEGRAVDVRLPGVALADLRDAARSLGVGGVGYYPREQFVHLDTGRVRHW